MYLDLWARRHGVSAAALVELRHYMGQVVDYSQPEKATVAESEGDVQNLVRLEAGKAGVLLWRNNVGCLPDKTGRPVRYGICNDSKQMNETLKSSDLVGIRPVLITADMVGTTVGQFIAREIKEPSWRFKGDAHETAQLNFLRLVLSKGGDAAFTNREGTI